MDESATGSVHRVRDYDHVDDSEVLGHRFERHIIEQLVGDLVGGGERRHTTLVVRGEAGSGRTFLLDLAVDSARRREARCLVARGVESETMLPFAALADLLLPLRDYMGSLPGAQRDSLEACLALAYGPRPGPLATCAGALGVLAAASQRVPLLIVIDDLQWVDPESAQIFAFVARRVATARLAMIIAVRDEPDTRPHQLDLPTVVLGGLTHEECARLAARLGLPFADAQVSSLLERTGGNPLAVVESLRAAHPSPNASGRCPLQRSPDEPRAGLHPSLERTWGRLWGELPVATRAAVFLVAADQGAEGRHVAGALRALGFCENAFSLAERRGLVRVVDGRLHLRHPLLRVLAEARTPLSSRAAGYHALARVAVGYWRLWYLAAAATEPDPALAEELLAAVGETRDRMGLMASARTLRRAAELTAEQPFRAERLLQAARDAHLAGDSALALLWCEEALALRDDPRFAVDVRRIACRAHTWLGEPGVAFDRLVAAAKRVRPIDPWRSAVALAEATEPAVMQGRMRRARDVAEEAESIWASAPEAARHVPPTVMAAVAEAFVLAGELHRAEFYLRAASAPHERTEVPCYPFLGRSLVWSERFAEAREHVQDSMAAARRLGAHSALAFALSVSAEIGWWTGHWVTAYADAEEALEWASEYHQAALVVYSLSMLARIEAARGDLQSCHARVDRCQREVEADGVACVGIYSASELGLASLGLGDISAAIKHLERSWRQAVGAGLGNPNVVPMSGDLAEALARAGRPEECGQVLDWLAERAQVSGLHYPRIAWARSQGILATDVDEAQERLTSALESLDPDHPMPFEQARTELVLGEVLRRARRAVASRGPLERAAVAFERLGARPWAARARAEFAASGASSHPRPWLAASTAVDELTPQELQVARATGRGLNNCEVASSLFISRKTVEAHLTRVYRKLGVRSRSELAWLLASADITD